jgi:hypothetical protein
MAEFSSDRSSLTTQTANRLRLVYNVDEPVDVRKGFLKDELARAIAAVTPENRRAFLLDLLGQFPSWDFPDPDPVKTDWRSLVTGLEALAQSLPASEQAALSQRLKEVGLIELPPTPPPEPPPSTELVRDLREFALGLENLWVAWSKLSSKGTLRPSGSLRDDIHSLLNGNKPAAIQLTQDLERLRKLLVAMTGAVGQVEHLFGPHLEQEQLTPQAIRDLVESEGGKGLLGNAKAAYWSRYEEQYNKVRSNLGKDFQAKIVQHVESWFNKRIPGR